MLKKYIRWSQTLQQLYDVQKAVPVESKRVVVHCTIFTFFNLTKVQKERLHSESVNL
jgi:hypothetical protein